MKKLAPCTLALVGIAMMGLFSCESCVDSGTDAGPDAGADVQVIDRDGGAEVDVEGADVIAVVGECNEDTPTFGDECGDCGSVICDPVTQELVCNDPGLNACDRCGDIDQTVGRVGDSCGEFGCGVALCDIDGTATECIGDREPNDCGGCGLLPFGRSPGQICSECSTGLETCTRNQNSLVCVAGRGPAFVDGSCDRRVFAHAYMDERLGGGYIRNGTLAIFENVDDFFQQDFLTFSPLVEGPGTLGLVLTHLFLTPGPEINIVTPVANDCITNGCPTGFDCVLDTGRTCVEGRFIFDRFAADIQGEPADPIRQFSVIDSAVLDSQYLILYDAFLNETISVGQIIPGAPDGFPLDGTPRESPDGGPLPDASSPDVSSPDASSPDASSPDASGPDAG